MKKTLSTKFVYAILFVLLLFISCQKDTLSPAIEGTDWAKEYYSSVLTNNKKLNQNHSPAKTASIGQASEIGNLGTPLWELATAAKSGDYTLVEVPLNYNRKLSSVPNIPGQTTTEEQRKQMAKASFDILMIYKKPNGTISQQIVSLMPDLDYLQRHRGDITANKLSKLDADFSGYLAHRDWDGQKLSLERIENGLLVKTYGLAEKVIRRLTKPLPKTSQKAVMNIRPGGGDENCYEVEFNDYIRYCEQISNTWDCYLEYVGEHSEFYCSTFQPTLDPIPDPLPKEIVVDSTVLNNAKIKCLLEKLMGKNGNTANPQFMSLLNAFVGRGFDVTFKIGTLQNNNANAETGADPNDPTKYNVVLNTTKINTETQMGWAKTLLHEAFHANLMQKSYELFGHPNIALWLKKPEEMSLDELMDQMESKVQDNITLGILHHNFMAENINDIKNGLKAFSLANNPNHSDYTDHHFGALAYQGMLSTSYYQNKVIKNSDGSLKTVEVNGHQLILQNVNNSYYIDLLAENISCN